MDSQRNQQDDIRKRNFTNAGQQMFEGKAVSSPSSRLHYQNPNLATIG